MFRIKFERGLILRGPGPDTLSVTKSTPSLIFRKKRVFVSPRILGPISIFNLAAFASIFDAALRPAALTAMAPT